MAKTEMRASSSDDAKARMVDARDRALSQLSALLPSPDEVVVIPHGNGRATADVPPPPTALAPAIPVPKSGSNGKNGKSNGKTKSRKTLKAERPIQDEPKARDAVPAPVVTDVKPGPETEWVPVALASRKARVDAATIRSWYRAGDIPTRRTRGERGAVLVPLADVLERAGAGANGHNGSGRAADVVAAPPANGSPVRPAIASPIELTAAVAALTGVEAPADVELLGRSPVDDMAAELDDLRDQLDDERRRRIAAERERDEAREQVENLAAQVDELEDRLASPLSWSLDELAQSPGYRGRWARERANEDVDDLVPTTAD